MEVRVLGEGCLVVHVLIDCKDAMGANLVNTVAEALGERVRELAGGGLGLRILTNLCDERRVRVTCRVGAEAFADQLQVGREVIRGIAQASWFAARDPYRAATHNKGLMNGLDAVVLATGNDFRAVEAGAHAYAARSGVYRPLSHWVCDGNELLGEAELPLALGTVGGTLGVHPAARLALKVARITSAADLCELAASAGLASNLAALRALATEGIQRGHMSLHARSLAASVGAQGDEVEQVAASLSESGNVTREGARAVLQRLRGVPKP